MSARLRRRFAAGVIAAALFAVSLGSAGSVSAAIDPVAFQKLGCNNGDYSCFYARLYGGYPSAAPFCNGSGCTYGPVGEPFYGIPYGVAPYYGSPYIAPYVAGNGVGYGYPGYVYPGNVVAIASTFQGGIITALNH